MPSSSHYLKLVLTTFFWAAVFHVAKYAVAIVSPLYAPPSRSFMEKQ